MLLNYRGKSSIERNRHNMFGRKKKELEKQRIQEEFNRTVNDYLIKKYNQLNKDQLQQAYSLLEEIVNIWEWKIYYRNFPSASPMDEEFLEWNSKVYQTFSSLKNLTGCDRFYGTDSYFGVLVTNVTMEQEREFAKYERGYVLNLINNL